MTEAQFHRLVAEYLNLALPPDVPWTTIGHGGGGHTRGARLKGMGVRAGWPDIHLIYKGRPVYIELKTGRGRLSPAQRAVHEQIMCAGGCVTVCRSIEMVQDFLAMLGVKSPLGMAFI